MWITFGLFVCGSRVAPCLGEMLYGPVQTAPGLFDGRHVPVDGAGLPGVPPVAQQLQRPLTLS